MKTYSDYLAYLLEKENVTDDIRATERVFLLEAYVPEESVSEVKTALENTTGACYYEFTEPDEEDNPPTLLKNNKAVRNFEDITNMYSVPNSREFDPNTVMGFFYSLFMGFIIGDMGYGLIMMLGGGLIWWKNRAAGKRIQAAFRRVCDGRRVCRGVGRFVQFASRLAGAAVYGDAGHAERHVELSGNFRAERAGNQYGNRHSANFYGLYLPCGAVFPARRRARAAYSTASCGRFSRWGRFSPSSGL